MASESVEQAETEQSVKEYIHYKDFTASKKTGTDYFAYLCELRNAYTPRPPGQASHADVEKFIKEDGEDSFIVVPPKPPLVKYLGTAYFDQLHDIFDDKISRRLMGGYKPGDQWNKTFEEYLAERCRNYTFNVSAGAWSIIENGLGVSDDAEPPPPLTYEQLMEIPKKRGASLVLFLTNFYVAQQRLDHLIDPSVVVEEHLLVEARAEQGLDFPEYDPTSERWDSMVLTTEHIEKFSMKRKVSLAFMEGHNRNVAAMQALLDAPPADCPRYGTWPKKAYADRMRSDQVLLKAAQLRDSIEDIIAVMRYEARLAISGVEVQAPYLEPEGHWEKFQKRSHGRKKPKALFDYESAAAAVGEVDPGPLRRWAVGYGDVEITEDITWTSVQSRPIRPESGLSPVVGGQAALQWAFYSSKTLKSYHRFTLPKTDGVSVIADFAKMELEVVVIREEITLRKVLPLDPMFAVPAETLEQKMEFKLLNEDEFSLLEQRRKDKEYLHWSVKTGHIDSAMEIVEKVADINAVDRDGFTALHLACVGNHVTVVKKLLELGANRELLDQGRNSCLHLAISNGHIDLALLLLESNCDINPKNSVSYCTVL